MSRSVGNHPRDNQWVTTEKEGEEIVSGQRWTSLGFAGDSLSEEKGETDNDGDDEPSENRRLELPLVNCVRGEQDTDELECSEWRVEQSSNVDIKAESLDQSGSKGVRNTGRSEDISPPRSSMTHLAPMLSSSAMKSQSHDLGS